MITDAIRKVVEGGSLTREEAAAAMEEIMEGRASDSQIAGLLVALRMKGETVDELVGFASIMRSKATMVKADAGRGLLVDTCGTGGDGSESFNISTAAAFVAAGAGARVVKHGNRSVSSRSGSADCMRALGVNIELPVEQIERCLDKIGICFLYAPQLHPAMRHAMNARRDLRLRTVFNMLGPLANPAGAQAQVVGVYDPLLTEKLASALAELGCRRAFVVHGAGGLDEISNLGVTSVSELNLGRISNYTITPETFGLPQARLEELRGGDPQHNALIVRRVLEGERGARRDIVLMNAAAALVAAELAENLIDAFEMARRSIDGGAALAKLEQLIAFTSGRQPAAEHKA